MSITAILTPCHRDEITASTDEELKECFTNETLAAGGAVKLLVCDLSALRARSPPQSVVPDVETDDLEFKLQSIPVVLRKQMKQEAGISTDRDVSSMTYDEKVSHTVIIRLNNLRISLQRRLQEAFKRRIPTIFAPAYINRNIPDRPPVLPWPQGITPEQSVVQDPQITSMLAKLKSIPGVFLMQMKQAANIPAGRDLDVLNQEELVCFYLHL